MGPKNVPSTSTSRNIRSICWLRQLQILASERKYVLTVSWRSRLVPLPYLALCQAGRQAVPGERPAGRRGGDRQQPGPTGGGRRAASRLAWLAVDGGRQTPVCGMLRERGGQRRVVVWLPRG